MEVEIRNNLTWSRRRRVERWLAPGAQVPSGTVHPTGDATWWRPHRPKDMRAPPVQLRPLLSGRHTSSGRLEGNGYLHLGWGSF
jgi:hypothetical protein